ncbi:hypothetical protein SLI_1189 [Streptomyces lividans 1326]|uniref:Uncharacterized protein n=1 Tax=Streptomyces lividans 1326 TaxID=1200984 RepID=A0A7U9DQL6_STRLI|nr:hypothetical protein SLI_1189 [Streptomyces lividans 1326]
MSPRTPYVSGHPRGLPTPVSCPAPGARSSVGRNAVRTRWRRKLVRKQAVVNRLVP